MTRSTEEPAINCLLAREQPVVEREGRFAIARRPDVDLHRCTTCEGQAHIPAYQGSYRVMRPCPGAWMDRRIELFNKARIPARYADAQLRTFEPRDASHVAILGALTASLAGFKPGDRGKLFHGPVGTGKTHLLVGYLRHLTLEKGVPCRYVEFSHLLAELRELYGQGRSEAEILGPLATIPVLAIDELGKGRCNDFELRIIDELISRRYNDASVTTFFATNYTPRPGDHDAPRATGDTREYLADRIGERSESRIFEMCEFVPLFGEDFRKHLYRSGGGGG